MLSAQEFTGQLLHLKDQYRNDNTWVGNWKSGSWNDENTMASYIQCAYNLYKSTATNALRLTLLGGTEIRVNEAYVRNFGITGVNGIQDPATRTHVLAEIRNRIGHALFPNQRTGNPDRKPAPIAGTGSILSEKGWTPILNDSLILGAITARQEFSLALTPEEQNSWDALNAHKVTRFSVAASRFEKTPALMDAWKAFFNANPKMFFDRGNPRVFSRELLGLYFFGYEPIFSWHQLSFQPIRGKVTRTDFQTYLRKLREVNFHSADTTRIMEALSTFLFKDPDVLGAV